MRKNLAEPLFPPSCESGPCLSVARTCEHLTESVFPLILEMYVQVSGALKCIPEGNLTGPVFRVEKDLEPLRYPGFH